jgi:hypothetical protein
MARGRAIAADRDIDQMGGGAARDACPGRIEPASGAPLPPPPRPRPDPLVPPPVAAQSRNLRDGIHADRPEALGQQPLGEQRMQRKPEKRFPMRDEV